MKKQSFQCLPDCCWPDCLFNSQKSPLEKKIKKLSLLPFEVQRAFDLQSHDFREKVLEHRDQSEYQRLICTSCVNLSKNVKFGLNNACAQAGIFTTEFFLTFYNESWMPSLLLSTEYVFVNGFKSGTKECGCKSFSLLFQRNPVAEKTHKQQSPFQL